MNKSEAQSELVNIFRSGKQTPASLARTEELNKIVGGSGVIDNTNKVLQDHDKIKDRALAYAAQDIEVIIKTGGRTPHRTGAMKASTKGKKIGIGKYQIEVPKAYASYQERGMRYDGSHRIRKYTTPGTSKGWFNSAIQTVAKNFPNLIKQATRVEGF
jgi:hypothetical protein